MKTVFTILLLIVSICTFAQQPDYAGVYHAIVDFDKALESKDTVALKWLVSDKVSYGHSNGWVENKKELVQDLFNGKLTYKKITATKPETTFEGNIVAARSVADIDAIWEGKLMPFKLKVLQIWLWENEHWVLFARQSVSVSKEK